MKNIPLWLFWSIPSRPSALKLCKVVIMIQAPLPMLMSTCELSCVRIVPVDGDERHGRNPQPASQRQRHGITTFYVMSWTINVCYERSSCLFVLPSLTQSGIKRWNRFLLELVPTDTITKWNIFILILSEHLSFVQFLNSDAVLLYQRFVAVLLTYILFFFISARLLCPFICLSDWMFLYLPITSLLWTDCPCFYTIYNEQKS